MTHSLHSGSFAGKRVLLRTSLNVPVMPDGSVGDQYRLTRALPTIEFLCASGARVIILAHLGRAGASLAPVAKTLSSLMPTRQFEFFDGPLTEAETRSRLLAPGACLVLENVRRDQREEAGDSTYALELAKLGDVYVDDAFADAHRAHASITGIPKYLPSFLGLLMEEEIAALSAATTPPSGSVAIVGGAKFETKEPLLQTLVGVYGDVLLGGALGNDLLRARGFPTGTSLVSSHPVPVSLANEPRIHTPEDVVVMEAGTPAERVARAADIRAGEGVVDVGPETIRSWGEKITNAPFVLWNGPLGVYEKGFTAGTCALAEAVVLSQARAVVGGGDTIAAFPQELRRDGIFFSTGGGAMLEFLVHGTLPGIDAVICAEQSTL